jgi:lipopolysaccharide export system permease protein
MTLFGRYALRQALSAFLLVMLSLTAVVWIATALKQLTLLTTQGQDASIFLQMTLLALPNLMAMIAPVALLIATLHTLNRLSGDSELIVMTAAGASVWRFATPFIVLSLGVAAFLALANHYVNPWSMRTLASYILKVRTDLISQVLQPGTFSSPETGITFHIRERDEQGRLLGLLMHDASDKKAPVTYLADVAEVVKRGESAYLVMRDGHIIQRPAKKGEASQIVRFKSNMVDLAAYGPKQTREVLKPRARYLGELLAPDPKDPEFRGNPGSFRSEIHERFASPLYPLAFAMIAIAYLGQARTNRQGRTQAIVTAFVVAIGLRIAGFAANNLVTLSAAAIPLAYAIPAGGMLVAAAAIRLRMLPRRQSRLGAALEAASDAAKAAAGRGVAHILRLPATLLHRRQGTAG